MLTVLSKCCIITMGMKSAEKRYIEGEDAVLIHLDKGIYSKEVLLKVAYAFTDRAYLHLSQSNNEWLISFIPKEGYMIDAREVENELIAQQLRAQLVAEHKDLRKIVLARAYASTLITYEPPKDDIEDDTEDDTSDDMRILEGWHEQHRDFAD